MGLASPSFVEELVEHNHQLQVHRVGVVVASEVHNLVPCMEQLVEGLLAYN